MSIRTDECTRAEPEPLTVPKVEAGPQWHILRRLKTPSYSRPPSTDFNDIFERRRSRRVMQSVRLSTVVNLVAYATASRFATRHLDIERRRRPSPSAGALHPIQILVIVPGPVPRAFLCDPDERALVQLRICDVLKIKSFGRQCAQVLPNAQGTLLVLVGDPKRVASAYRNETSLLWRDAGALLQTLFMAATAFELSFCPIGLLGQDALAAVAAPTHLEALGAAFVGL